MDAVLLCAFTKVDKGERVLDLGTGNGVIACLSKLETTMRHMEILPLEMLPVIRLNRHYMLPALKEAGENFARIHDTWKQR